jgi:CHASE2 domain-containing sensor protein
VPGPSHDDLRRLAGWLARRREVDELMAVLTQYGPTANERVASHLRALEALLEAEREAFDRYASAAPDVPQRPLPTVVAEDEDDLSNVHPLFAARAARNNS